MSDRDESKDSGNDIVKNISKAYEDGPDSYEFPIDDGEYWRKVRRYKNIKEIIENK